MKFQYAAPFIIRPRYEERGLLLPRKYIDGQWQPGQKFQFQDGNVDPLIVDAPVSYVDDGDFLGSSGTTVNITVTTTGPVSVFLGGGRRGATAQLNSATLNGAASSFLYSTSTGNGVAFIVGFNQAATSHTLALTFNGSVTGCAVSAISLSNLQSLTPIDSDGATGTVSTSPLAVPAMTDPGAEGITLGAAFDFGNGVTNTWNNITEIADYDSSGAVGRNGAAVILGNPAGAISFQKASSSFTGAVAGMTLR